MANQDFNARRYYTPAKGGQSAFGEGIYEKLKRLETENQQLQTERDDWKEIAYSLAQYEANANGTDVEQVITDEKHWLERQKQWNTIEDIR